MEQTQQRYLATSTYTYAGAYGDYFRALPESAATIGKLVCDQVIHPSLLFQPPSRYLEDAYYGPLSAWPKHRFRNEDELFLTAAAMTAEIFRRDPTGFVPGKNVTKRLAVSCRQASVLFSAILKAKGIPCRSRAGFMDFGNDGASYMEHWVNEYWLADENRWVLVDADGYYEYEQRYGYSQFDLPRRKFITAAEAWLGLRRRTLDAQKLNVIAAQPLEGVCEYLMMDFHGLMNNEIYYTHQPQYLRNRIGDLSEAELQELDGLAALMLHPDEHLCELESLWENHERFYALTNGIQNVYQDTFGTS